MRKGSEAYGAFAWAYDQALGAIFFETIAQVLSRVDDDYPAGEKTHLDVACGTGYVVDFFTRRGYRSFGIDASVPMLSIARGRAETIAAADMRTLPFAARRFSRVTSVYDSLNHLTSPEELLAAFRAVREVMTGDGLFFFDVNHPDAYPRVWGAKEPFVSSGDDFHLALHTRFSGWSRIGTGRARGWARVEGRKIEIDETHRQRAWSEKEVAEIVVEAGLRVVDIFNFDPFNRTDPFDDGGLKIFFITERDGR